MSAVASGDAFTAAILRGIRMEADRIIEEEAVAAGKRAEQRLRELAPQLAMRLLTNFDVERGLQRIIITVRNLEPGK